MKDCGIERYESPVVVIFEYEYEGVICTSNEGLNEIPGIW